MGYDDRAGMEGGLAPEELLIGVRIFSEETVRAGGGSLWESDAVADEVTAYVDFNWRCLGLRGLAGHPDLWERHLRRAVLQRWLGLLNRLAGHDPPLRESLARARVFALVDDIGFSPGERILFEYIFVHGFSLAETAVVSGLGHAELVQRLRLIWAAVRRQAEIAQNRGD